MAIKLVFGSLKGGVGKTTTSNTISLLLQDQRRKTLLIDLDPAADATNKIMGDSLKGGYIDVYEAMQKKDLRKGIISVTPYLDLLPSSSRLKDFPNLLTNSANKDFVGDLVSEIENDYEFILFDLSPLVDELNVNALAASDYVIPLLGSTDLLTQNTTYLHYVEEMKTTQKGSPQILGIVASLITRSRQNKNSILSAPSLPVKDLLFESVITDNKEEGINPVVMYQSLLKEILYKLEP